MLTLIKGGFLCFSSARVIKSLGQRTVFRGIWLIVLFVYKYVADTVSNLLKCVRLKDGNVFKLVSTLALCFFHYMTCESYAGVLL